MVVGQNRFEEEIPIPLRIKNKYASSLFSLKFVKIILSICKYRSRLNSKKGNTLQEINSIVSPF